MRETTLDQDKTMVSYDGHLNFYMHSHWRSSKYWRNRCYRTAHLSSRTNCTPDHICALSDLCLMTTYFQHSQGFYRQKHSCLMGSPVSPAVIMASLYMESVMSIGVYAGHCTRDCTDLYTGETEQCFLSFFFPFFLFFFTLWTAIRCGFLLVTNVLIVSRFGQKRLLNALNVKMSP